jgi:hypothetical protein
MWEHMVWFVSKQNSEGSGNRIDGHTCYQFLGWPVAELALARLFVFLASSISISVP